MPTLPLLPLHFQLVVFLMPSFSQKLDGIVDLLVGTPYDLSHAYKIIPVRSVWCGIMPLSFPGGPLGTLAVLFRPCT